MISRIMPCSSHSSFHVDIRMRNYCETSDIENVNIVCKWSCGSHLIQGWTSKDACRQQQILIAPIWGLAINRGIIESHLWQTTCVLQTWQCCNCLCCSQLLCVPTMHWRELTNYNHLIHYYSLLPRCGSGVWGGLWMPHLMTIPDLKS